MNLFNLKNLISTFHGKKNGPNLPDFEKKKHIVEFFLTPYLAYSQNWLNLHIHDYGYTFATNFKNKFSRKNKYHPVGYLQNEVQIFH
jgi:hypothetical protein